MNTHPAIDKWGRKKYNLPDNATVFIEQETRSGGYCETCYYEEEVMVIYSEVDGKRTKLAERSVDMATMLREILDAVV